jgi:hypothetical protein
VARALNVLPLEHAIAILLFYMRNLLIMADDADAAHDDNAAAIFAHLGGIVSTADASILVIALQTLVTFHPSPREIAGVVASPHGAAVLTRLLQVYACIVYCLMMLIYCFCSMRMIRSLDWTMTMHCRRIGTKCLPISRRVFCHTSAPLPTPSFVQVNNMSILYIHRSRSGSYDVCACCRLAKVD